MSARAPRRTRPWRPAPSRARPFRWTLKREGIIAPDERLPWPQTIAVGVQHIFAMFGATVLAPILMGFDPNTAILFSGIGTLIFFVVVGGRVPSYLGSSFAFIAVVIAATGYDAAAGGPNPNLAVALGGIIAAGALYAADRPRRHGRRHGVDRDAHAAGRHGRRGRRHRPQPRARRREPGIEGTIWTSIVGLLTALSVGLVAVYAPGMLRRLPILLGGVIGYVLYFVLANGLGLEGLTPISFDARRGRGLDRPAEPHRARRST